MSKYVIGVDGGNTKTHYALFDSEGNLINFLEAGTASHERMLDGYEGMKREMRRCIDILLAKAGLKIEDVGYGVFGLAGADIPKQYMEIEKRIKEIGLNHFKVYNDAFLGVKAGCENGYGICSINGTGTSCVGVDKFGNWIQIGGLGTLSSDFAGGGYISDEVMRLVYDSIYKSGTQTLMKDMVFRVLDIINDDDYVEAVYDKVHTGKINKRELSRIAFLAANDGDQTAAEILRTVGRETARAVIGVYRRLDFLQDEKLYVVMAGSVYVKGENPILVDTFKKEVSENTECEVIFHMLQEPPVAGAVIWALEELNQGLDMKTRQKVLENLATV